MGVGDLQLVMRGVASAPLGGPGAVALTATENGPTVDTGAAGSGTALDKPMIWALIVAGPVTGTTPSVVGKLQHSEDNSVWEDLVYMPEQQVAGSLVGAQVSSTPGQITAVGEYRVPFATKRRYLRHVLTVAGTSPNFGVVTSRIEEGY